MANADPRVKKIKIQTGVVKRITKEKGYYEQEVIREEQRYEKKKSDGGDDHDLRKQTEVINETKAMIPDTKSRLLKSCGELKNMLESEKDLDGTDDYKAAQNAVEEAEAVLKD
ncbi:tubulin-specific chaperone A-like [Ruditapes philippinarum]|uniref:tubulin-specific chaperone A-like n=1 Tax=Ruditapes philippinarum TaxID=129788 RepID=UPI00295A77AE|nr:tubulin-specific chaperone A-like [Ruditapes philippinarum]